MATRIDMPDLHSVEAEQALLGGLLVANTSFHQVTDHVSPSDFHDPMHKQMADKLWGLFGKGHSVTPITLATTYPDASTAEIAPGMTVRQYIIALVSEAVSVQHLTEYAKVIRNFSLRRELNAECLRMQQLIGSVGTDTDIADLVDAMEAPLYDIREKLKGNSYRWAWEAAAEAVEGSRQAMAVDGTRGLSTGLQALDNMIGPMFPGDVVAIVAPSGAGKTALASQLMVANSPRRSLMVQMEMTSIGIAQRMMASKGCVTVQAQRAGRMKPGDLEALEAEAEAMKTVPIIVDDSGRQTMRSIRSRIRQMKHRYGVDLVIIDNLQLLEDDFQGQNEIDKISRASKGLKALAKESGVVLVMLSQLTRASQKEAKHWRFSDQAVFGGDALKQGCDIMLGVANPFDFLGERISHQDTFMEEKKAAMGAEQERWRGYAEIGALKLREGEKGQWKKIAYDGKTLTFADPS